MSISTKLIRQETRAELVGRLLDIVRKESTGPEIIQQAFKNRIALQKLKNSVKIKPV